MIENKKKSGDEAEFTRHQERVKNYETWKDKHKVSQVKPGDMLDVLDTEYVWCRATVELKIKQKDR